MIKALKKKMKADVNPDLKIGEGFNDQRGEIPDLGAMPTHNGLNINNEAQGLKERNIEKAKRRPAEPLH